MPAIVQKFSIYSKEFQDFNLGEINSINNVCDYLKIIAELQSKIKEEMKGKTSEYGISCLVNRISKLSLRTYLWFRGEDKEYKTLLLPTAFRKDEDEKDRETVFQKIFIEREMYKYTWLHDQQIVSNLQDYINLNTLSILRHFGLRTRLLDFSTDPLVALFFSLGDDKNYKEDGYVYIIIPNLLNFQVSYLNYILFLSTSEDYNVNIRLRTFLHSELIMKILKEKCTGEDLKRLTKELKFNSKLFNEAFTSFKENFTKCINCEEKRDKFNELVKNIEKYIKQNYIPIEIYLTPIAVIFQYANRYMEHQKACGILYGEIYGKCKADYSLINQLKSPYFLFNYIELPESISPLYRIRIPNDKKETLRRELQKNFRLSKYEIFGKDLRFLEEKVKSELDNIIPIDLE